MDFILVMVGLGIIYMLYVISLKFDQYVRFVKEQTAVFQGYMNTLLTYTIRNSEPEKVEKTAKKPAQKKATQKTRKNA